MRVYYLTTQEHAISNIGKKRIKISLFDDLNDPFELLPFDMSNKRQREVWKRFREYLNTRTGIVCFSDQWQNPVMWSHYADKHKGICLGFDINAALIKVNYIKKRKSFDIGEEFEAHGITPSLVRDAVSSKFEEWSYEREYRGIIDNLENPDSEGRYFSDFDEDFQLKEVIIGARCKLTPVQFKNYLSSYSHPVTVMKSRLAFKSFSVVENKSIEKYLHGR